MQFDSQSLWIYIHFPRLQLDSIEQSCIESDSDKHTGSPVPRAIYQSATNQLVQINQTAFDQGLRIGMGLAKASLMYSQLQLHEYNPGIEQNCIEQIAQKLYLVTSDIALAPPRGLMLRAQHMLHLHRGLGNYWRIIEYCLADHRYHYHAACAFSIQAAKLIALHGKRLISDNREQIQQQLYQCQLNVSDIDPKDIEKLNRIGVHNVGQLCAIPAADLANRVNRHSMKIINELRGKAPAQVTFYQPASEFHDYLELLYDIDNTDKLLPVIKRCLTRLEHFLYVRNARSLRIALDLHQREHTPIVLEFASALPIYRVHDWLDIIQLRLERLTLDAPVHAVELHCLQHEVTAIANDDLFSTKSQHIAGLSLLSRLFSRLGEHKVSGLQYRPDFRPENTTQLSTFGKHNMLSYPMVQEDRPGLLLPRPTPLIQQVNVIKGPERIISGWWDDNPVQRDYFVGEDAHGQQVWIFKTPDDKWYLHGFFV